MIRAIVDLFATMVQTYISACLVCKIFSVKQPYSRSLLCAFLQMLTSYFVVNYIFNETIPQRVVCGGIVFVIGGFSFFEGTRLQQLLRGILQHMLFFVMEFTLELVVFCFFINIIKEIPFSQRQLIGRNIATLCVFVLYMLYELHENHKKAKGIAVLALCLGIVQFVILDLLSRSNPKDMVDSRLVITVLFSVIAIGGFLVVNELFTRIWEQQKKQNDLEQMALEQQYQYDYYKKAYEQSEKIRDIRHDMRNQLQTVEVLLRSEQEKDRIRGNEMIERLGEKIC